MEFVNSHEDRSSFSLAKPRKTHHFHRPRACYITSMKQHIHVKHPAEILAAKKEAKKLSNPLLYLNDAVLEWITNHVLASVILFDIALIIPLLTLNAPDSVKITLGVISGSWIQWWALPALQRSQNKTQAQNDAKAEVDHETLTYLANLQDEQMTELTKITELIVAVKQLDNKK